MRSQRPSSASQVQPKCQNDDVQISTPATARPSGTVGIGVELEWPAHLARGGRERAQRAVVHLVARRVDVEVDVVRRGPRAGAEEEAPGTADPVDVGHVRRPERVDDLGAPAEVEGQPAHLLPVVEVEVARRSHRADGSVDLLVAHEDRVEAGRVALDRAPR